MSVSDDGAPSSYSASYTSWPSGRVFAIAVSVMQMATTRPTGRLATHCAHRLLSEAVLP